MRLVWNGARPLRSLQGGAVPGSDSQRSPPSATGGPSQPPCCVRGRWRRATGRTKARKDKPFTIMHWNAESVMNKKTELEHILHEENINICCIQETHLQSNKYFKVRGYQCFRSDRTDRSKGGVLTLVRNNINACLIDTHMEDSEYQVMEIKADAADIQLVNYYCPNDKLLSLDTISTEVSNFIIVGDFNSHSQSWGYEHMDWRGEEVENWQDENRLLLINSLSDQPMFYSRRWHTTSTPDIALCTEDLHGSIRREVGEQLGGRDHRPVFLKLNLGASTEATFPRWNYKKANWTLFRHRTSTLSKDITVQGRDINMVAKGFNSCILKAAQETIPRGARRNYRPYWSQELQDLHDALSEARAAAEVNPSQENNTKLQQAKAKFLRHKIRACRRGWREKTASLNFEKDDQKLWKITKQLSDEDNSRAKLTLEENSKLLTGKQAADKFAENYANESKIPVSTSKQREARREIRRWQPVRYVSTLAVQQCANSCRSTTTAGNKGCFHRYGKKQLWSPFWRKERTQRRQTAIDQLAWPRAWWRPWEALWMSAWSGIWKRRTSLHQNRQDSDSSEAQIKPCICLKKSRTPSKNRSWSSRKRSTKSRWKGYLSNCWGMALPATCSTG